MWDRMILLRGRRRCCRCGDSTGQDKTYHMHTTRTCPIDDGDDGGNTFPDDVTSSNSDEVFSVKGFLKTTLN